MTLEGLARLRLQVRRGRHPGGSRHKVRLRPALQGRFPLPRHEFGRDVIAPAGALRHAEQRSAPEVHAALVRRGGPIGPRRGGNLLDRSDALLALSRSDVERRRRVTAAAGRVVRAIEGLQPDVGHEVLRVLRDVLSGAVLLARRPLSSTQGDLARLIAEVQAAWSVPIGGVTADGQESIRKGGPEGARRRPASTLPVP